ncbi:MAG TPA: polyprenyl synthetase family protein [Frankiaceae bacterium]|nr:polyprenyl synthetase family protein [Frankiaceae bacterium]
MTASPAAPADRSVSAVDIRNRVRTVLVDFLAEQSAVLDAIGVDLEPVTDALHEFLLNGGKRLRPTFAYWGHRGAGGLDGEGIISAAASLELLHACALIHDDVMDGSDTRRGHPAVHRRFATLHAKEGWAGSSATFGESAAILLGDLCLVWAEQMLTTCGLPEDALRRTRPVYDEMRVELMSGQYLDLLEQARGGRDMARALRVARYKSAKYTIERPLHVGASLAGDSPAVRRAYSAYGLPLGEAFQLRDDVLGVFGDPEVTGKPAGDDLREGKRTVLIAMVLDHATQAQSAVVHRHLGDPDLDPAGIDALRTVIADTGALDRVEALIEERTAGAIDALGVGRSDSPLTAEAARALQDLAVAATSRRV